MPDKNVQLPDGRVVSFPDSMADADISAVIKKQMTPQTEVQKAMQDPRFFEVQNPPTQERVAEALPSLGGSLGGLVGGVPGAMLGGSSGEAGKELLTMGATGKPTESPVTDIAKSGVLQGLFQYGGQKGAEGAAWIGGKLAPVASQSLARILRLSPKAFQFGKEPAQEVLERGLVSGNMGTMKESIGEASRQVTSELSSALKKAPGTVDAFAAGTEASKSIPNDAAASRFEQLILDSADKLGLKNLDKLSNVDANALKQEVARQARFIEGDLRPSIASAAKQFGGKVKDRLISNAPEAEPLLESSANLTEASKAADYAIRSEKAGQGRSGLGSFDVKRPSTYVRPLTDTPSRSDLLFKFANGLKDSGIPISQALRAAFSLIYSHASDATP